MSKEGADFTVKISLDSTEFQSAIERFIERIKPLSDAFEVAFASDVFKDFLAASESKGEPKVCSMLAERIFEAILKQVETGHALKDYDPNESAKLLEDAAIYLGLSEVQK